MKLPRADRISAAVLWLAVEVYSAAPGRRPVPLARREMQVEP